MERSVAQLIVPIKIENSAERLTSLGGRGPVVGGSGPRSGRAPVGAGV